VRSSKRSEKAARGASDLSMAAADNTPSSSSRSSDYVYAAASTNVPTAPPAMMWSPRCLSSLQPAVVRTLPAPLARCLDADARCQYNTTMHPKTMLPAPTVRLQPQLNSMHTAPTAAAAAVSPTDAGHSHLIERFYVQ
jgi:hypothetical protein